MRPRIVRPAVEDARRDLRAALDAARLPKSRRAAIEAAVNALVVAMERAHVEGITPETIGEALAETGRAVWLDGYHHCLRDVSRELSGTFDGVVEALSETVSELKIDGVMNEAGYASIDLWAGADDATRGKLRGINSRPLAALVQQAREKVAPALEAVVLALPAGEKGGGEP